MSTPSEVRVVWIPFVIDAAGDRVELGAFTSEEEAVKAARIWQAGRGSEATEMFYDGVAVYDTADDWLADR